MSRRELVALGLAVALAVPASATGACPEPASRSTSPELVRPQIERARDVAGQGDCDAAAATITAAYDALASQPRRHLDALHALFTDVVHLQLAAHHARVALLSAPVDPALVQGPLCAADVLALRHRARVRAIGRASPAFEATIAGLRSELHARLAGAQCPAIDPADDVLRAPAPATGFHSDLLLRPGQLATETRERRPPPKDRARWQAASRGGFALMAVGLMVLGGGIAAGAAEGRGQGALQGSLLTAGTLMFAGGVPLLIIGDQRARAALAIGPGGARLAF